ncbi:MAG TPA: aminotransferase class V-fold PLP-dependent enzyme, partial [Phycisphaerales bacterium]|nr:aminotransferase class V-fold PLP-dependent enzyme [Phycisphaerales bacterium]
MSTVNPLEHISHLVQDLLDSERSTPVRPTLDPEDAERMFGLAIPKDGSSADEIVGRLREVVLATPTTSGPRFYNQLFGGREPVATLAEMLTAAMNISMYTYKVAGVQVLIERVLLEHMANLAGLSGGDGLFTPGGSMSNMAAMIIARNEADASVRNHGMTGGRRVVYTSAEAHYSVRKNAGMIGLGRENVRKVPVDAAGRMIPKELERMARLDRDGGSLPVMVIATAGTTVMGAFDPIGPIAGIAGQHGLWLHVDGAYGGSALLSGQSAPLLAGLDRADSFAWDAHKAMGVPLTCSVLLTRKPGLMTRHFDESATYLFQQDSDSLNPGTRSLQCGRRNDALKLWALWQHLGDAGFARRTDRQLALASHVRGVVQRDPML